MTLKSFITPPEQFIINSKESIKFRTNPLYFNNRQKAILFSQIKEIDFRWRIVLEYSYLNSGQNGTIDRLFKLELSNEGADHFVLLDNDKP